jgi:asparagine synthase (glutamine-hydrolysing)
MCGIWTFINLLKLNIDYKILYDNFMKIKHRGPDISIFQTFKNIFIGFHRLAIMDLKFHANQPYIFEEDNRTIIFLCNGEIYNFKELVEEHNIIINNNSDCMTIPKLYLKYDLDTFYNLFNNNIKGEFAFILF